MSLWKGILPAVITPFDEDGAVDTEALAVQLDRLANAGCTGIVMNAVTGEGASLTPEERARTVACAVETLKGRAVVIATAGSVGDYETVADINNAAKLGADGLMIISPYFYRLSTAERVDYFRRMGAVSDLPYIVYNTTYTSPMLSVEELEQIAEASPTMVGVKEGQQLQASEAIRRLSSRVGVYTSRDSYIAELGLVGGAGAVTYTTNVVPELTVNLWKAVEAGDVARAKELQQALNVFAYGLVVRSFPSAIKACLRELGWDSGRLRTPLHPMNAAETAVLREALLTVYPQLPVG